MALRNTPLPARKPEVGETVTDGLHQYEVLSVGLKYVNVRAKHDPTLTGCLKISSVFIVNTLPVQAEPEEEEEE